MATQTSAGTQEPEQPASGEDAIATIDAAVEHPAVVMLGKGWFPEQLGGLDRYYRDLLEHLPEARGLIVGPAPESPPRLTVVSRHDAPLLNRLGALWRAADQAGRDAVVIDAHFALYALLPLLSKRLRSLPLVVHFQGPWADENVSAGDSSPVRHRLRRGLERLVYRRADRVIVLTSAFRRVLVENYGVSPWRVHVVPPGVDLDRFSPGDRGAARERFGLDADAFVAVSVRRLVPRMGLDVLLEAWARALAELPQGAQLLIAGDGSERAALEAQVERLGLAKSVRLLGRISDEDLLELYRAADLGVVPTRSFEGFGLVVIEAAACGTPTIVTDIGGLPEAVHSLDPSLTVAPDDVLALAERMAAAARPGGTPSREETRSFAEGFSWSAAVRRNRDVMREAIDPNATARRRMRVVYLDHVAQLSGGEIALLRLLPHLDEVEPHVILAEDGPFADRLVQAGISIEVLPMRESARNLRKERVTAGTLPLSVIGSTTAYTIRLAIHLRRLRPDVVHTNSLKSGIYGCVAARLAGVPAVWHIRDRISEDYLPKHAVRLVRLLTRHLPNFVIANSHSTMDTLDPHVSPIVVYSVLPEVLIPPARYPMREPGEIVVGIIGRLAPWKGQDLVLRAFAEAFPTGPARCVLVGSPMFGEIEYEAWLHSLAKELGIHDRVDFRGFRNDVWSELWDMDILVHASLTPEPFGQVVLEGLAAGVAVVAADAGGPAEIVEHDVNGLLYAMGDSSALAKELHRLGTDSDLRLRLVAAGRATLAAYGPDAVVPRLESLYREATGSGETR
ncbi:glycosyltransferase [Aromatoleum sp.]|uniref:glycosyltransferase n=1 Tax=Aromatoleum sp. TaxID=2307007 RepID=UPI002FC6462D